MAPLPEGVPPRLVHGHYDLGFAIDGNFDRRSLAELRDLIQTSVRSHSGWPPFLTLDRPPFSPKPADGAVECWIGPETDGSYDRPSHHDFWRVSPEGLLFTRVYEGITGIGSPAPEQQVAAQALLAYLFEACDIFEDRPSRVAAGSFPVSISPRTAP